MAGTLLKAMAMAVLLTAAGADYAAAHHVLGRPAYSLNEDSNTPSSLQAEMQVGGYMVTYMVFPAFPQPNAPGRISLYVKRLDNGETFAGKVSFKIRDDVMIPGLQTVREESIGVQELDDNMVFRQSFQFSQAGNYIVSARFQADGEPHIIDFPLRVGNVPLVSPLVITVVMILVVLVMVNITQRRRAMTGKVRGARGGPTET